MKTCPYCTSGYNDQLTNCPTHGSVLNEIRELKPGLILRSTYRIVRQLGQGAMGTVYLAEQMLMHEPRALKFLSPDLAGDQSFTSRFLREVKTLRKVRHINVIDCGDLEQAEDNSLFFSMEFVDGPDLRHLMHMARGPMPIPMALEIARGMATGLGAAHGLGLVHRDIKPENILMARNGEKWTPKIADFGIVATKEAAGRTHTLTGVTLLTMAYAAPEQWQGMRAGDYDGRTDLYALGGVLYEMLAGKKAFDGENYESWSRLHLTVLPEPPSRHNPEIDRWQGLNEITLRLLEKRREDRFQSVAAFLAALEHCHEETAGSSQPAPAPPPPRLGSMPPPPLGSIPAQAGSIPPPAPMPFLQYPPANPGNSTAKVVAWVLGTALVLVVGFLLLCVGIAKYQASKEPVKDGNYYLTQGNQFDQQQQYANGAQAFETACSMGSATGCNNLGVDYFNGQGIGKDIVQAQAYFQRACTAGSSEACNNLNTANQAIQKAKEDAERDAALAAQQAAAEAELDSVIREVNVNPQQLTLEQKVSFVSNLKTRICPCGCGHTILSCYRVHPTCPNRQDNIQQTLNMSL